MIGGGFMPQLHLRQPWFTYSTCRPVTTFCENIKKFQETGNLNCIYKNELDKVSFAHDGAYADSKNVSNRNFSD